MSVLVDKNNSYTLDVIGISPDRTEEPTIFGNRRTERSVDPWVGWLCMRNLTE